MHVFLTKPQLLLLKANTLQATKRCRKFLPVVDAIVTRNELEAMFSRLVRNSTRMTGALASGLYLSNEPSTPSLCAGSSKLSTSERLSNLDVQLSAFEKKLESSKPAQKKPVGPIIVDPLEEPLKDVVWEVPGSKSITNRALILAALRPGTTTLTGEWISVMRWRLEPIIPTQRNQTPTCAL